MKNELPGRPIAYLVPKFVAGEATHFAHLPHFLESVGGRTSLHVIVERGDAPPVPSASSITLQRRHTGRFARSVELLRIVRSLRGVGCTRIFVRISQGAALVLNLARPFLRMEVLYWNSGAAKPAWPGWRESPSKRAALHLQDVVTRLNVRLSTRFVTGPERMVHYYTEHYGVPESRCIVLYNDIDTHRFAPVDREERSARRAALDIPDDECALLFVGRLSRYKGGANLAPILRSLASTGLGADCRVLVAGEAQSQPVEDALSGDPRVHLLGSIPNDRLPDLYRAADVFLLPSNAEGFPRALLEAMAAGLPVVAFDVGGVRDILGDRQQRFVVSPGDTASFAARIADLLASPTLRTELGSENLDRVQLFDTPNVAEMFVDRIVRPAF